MFNVRSRAKVTENYETQIFCLLWPVSRLDRRATERWTEAKSECVVSAAARAHRRHNVPANSINALEMWQEANRATPHYED
jgi:hypothetical protein